MLSILGQQGYFYESMTDFQLNMLNSRSYITTDSLNFVTNFIGEKHQKGKEKIIFLHGQR